MEVALSARGGEAGGGAWLACMMGDGGASDGCAASLGLASR